MIKRLTELTPDAKIRVRQSPDGTISLDYAKGSNVTATVQSVAATSDPGTWTVTTDVGTLCELASAQVHVLGDEGYREREY